MQVNLWELWGSMGFAVRCVVLLLTAQAVSCVAVVIDRTRTLYQSGKRARAFAAESASLIEANDYPRVLAQVQEAQSNHLSNYLEAGLRTFLQLRQAGESTKEAVEFARRALERRGEAIGRDLNKHMNVLASTGSTAPFVGLLGTVLGIINAFKLIAATGSGGIGTIGGAIGESLVVTGYGLVVAIPSVLVFNWLSARIAAYESGLVNAGGELLDRMARSPAPIAHEERHPEAPLPRPSFRAPRVG
jgi:biopolymer transport protein ExbB/TolQ